MHQVDTVQGQGSAVLAEPMTPTAPSRVCSASNAEAHNVGYLLLERKNSMNELFPHALLQTLIIVVFSANQIQYSRQRSISPNVPA